MICSNCGKNNAEGSAFCEDCGTALTTGNMQTPSPAPEVPTEAPAEMPMDTPVATEAPAYDMPAPDMADAAPAPEKKSDSKTIITIVAAVAVIAVVIFGITTIFGGGYKKPIDQYFDGINSGKAETFIKAFSKGQEKEIKKDDEEMDDVKDMLEERKKYLEEAYEDEIGDDIKIKYKVLDAVKMTKDELNDDDIDECEEWLEEEYYDDDVEISSGYRVALKITYKGDKGSKEQFTTMEVYKVNGHWCILDD